MKRTFKYALTAVLGTAIIAPAFAQDNFPDVPDNHWAYEALARMKRDGLLVGYPDGLFRGGRPASRYELAVAIHATYVHLKNITDSLQSQIDALKNNADLQAMKDAIASLQNDVNALKGMRADLDSLRKMVDTFQKELQALGVDVEAMKKDLADLDARVTVLEKRKPAVDISGDVSLWLGAGNSTSGLDPLNKDGRALGPAEHVGNLSMTRDVSMFHEGAITLAGTNETGPKWRGTFVIGNMLNDGGNIAFGDQSSVLAVDVPYTEPSDDWYIQDLGIRFDTSVAGLGFNAEAGRVGLKVSPYIFQRPDNTTYFANERWDDGMWRFDGAILGFNFGSAKFKVFGGKNGERLSTNGVDINPMVLGESPNAGGTILPFGANVTEAADPRIKGDRSLGATLDIPLSTAGNVNLAYIFLDYNDTPTSPNPYNRVAVYGGSANYNLGSLRIEGGASGTNLQHNSDDVITNDNKAWYGKLAYTQPSWSVFAAYREIGAAYAAPGDWGRLGVLRNPVNIKGFQVGASLDITKGLSLSANGEFDKGKNNGGPGDFQTPWDTDTKLSKWEVKLGYNLSSNVNIGVGYEEDKFESLANGAPDPRFRWTTFDLGYGLSETARLLLRYELSDHENLDSVSAWGLANQYKGGFLTTQLSLKF